MREWDWERKRERDKMWGKFTVYFNAYQCLCYI